MVNVYLFYEGGAFPYAFVGAKVEGEWWMVSLFRKELGMVHRSETVCARHVVILQQFIENRTFDHILFRYLWDC